MTGVEFRADDGDEAPDGSPDILELGGSKWAWLGRVWAPRREFRPLVRVLGWTVALGLGLGIGLAVHKPAHHSAAPVVQHDAARISMTEVRRLANQQGRLVSYVRQASPAHGCALVPVGHSPARKISTAINTAFRGYTVEDVGRTLDQFTGLCSIEVRARHRSAVLFVTVASPPARPSRSTYTRVETGIESDNGITTKYALALNETGWSTLVGATGPSAQLPGANDLVRLAQDAPLIW